MQLQKRLLDQVVGPRGAASVREQVATHYWREQSVEVVERLETARLVLAHQLAQPRVFCHGYLPQTVDRIRLLAAMRKGRQHRGDERVDRCRHASLFAQASHGAA